MPHAIDVQFLKVRGVIVIGNVPLPYKFTLVKYDLSINGILWVIFSNLNDALYKEFKEGFFSTLNVDRKDRWGFEQVAWLDGPYEYDVDFPYSDIWMSIFEPSGTTSREVRPFVYNDDHLRVHRNGAAVYSEEKKLIFLLPLIVQAYACSRTYLFFGPMTTAPCRCASQSCNYTVSKCAPLLDTDCLM